MWFWVFWGILGGIARSSNGRTCPSEGCNLGSSPSLATSKNMYTTKFWNTLSHILKQEEYLLHTRLSPEILKQRYEDGFLFVSVYEEKPIAMCVLWDSVSDPSWMELGTLWVHPEHRGKGLAKQMFGECMDKAQSVGVHIFLITHKQSVISIAESYGWKQENHSWMQDPFWVQICSPWDRYPTTIQPVPQEGVLCYFKNKK